MDEIILRNLFKNVDVGSLNDPEKVLTFYRLAIELERTKEPEINEFFEYPINFHRDERIILIDFPCNEPFLKKFELNRNRQETKFPSDLYVGLRVRIGDVSYRLLNMVIDYNDVKDIKIEKELLPVRISDLEVNLKEASHLELLPETIDIINAGIKKDPTWQGITAILRKEVSEDISLDDHLFLALSSKSVVLSQITSELGSRRLLDTLAAKGASAVSGTPRQEMQHQPSLLESFLLNRPFENEVEEIDPDSLISVTSLDDSQREAVAKALGSRVSVITGAPGTGKTQVIENILANALIRGKKVLVASKNNKAVENVKERFDEIDSLGYFLRFGSKQVISTVTLPAMERLKNAAGRHKEASVADQVQDRLASGYKILKEGIKSVFGWGMVKQALTNVPSPPAGQDKTEKPEDVSEDFDTCMMHYEESVKAILEGKKAIEREKHLQDEIQGLAQRLEDTRDGLSMLEAEHERRKNGIEERNLEFLPLKDCSLNELNSCLFVIKTLDNDFAAKFDGFLGFWHRLFSVRKSAALLLKATDGFPQALKDCTLGTGRGICSSARDFRSHKDLFDQISRWRNLINDVLLFRKDLSGEESRYQREKAADEKALERLTGEKSERENELTTLKGTMPAALSLMEESKRWIGDNGTKMLKAYVLHQLKNREAARVINDYRDYLPDQIPWKNEEYRLFVRRTKDFLKNFQLCSVTSLSAKSAFPLSPELFDMVVIDEASQCDIASVLPLVLRTKQLVVIGDPMQLRHISAVTVEEEQQIRSELGLEGRQYVRYAECSLYDYCKDYIANASSGQKVPYMLRYHYRCHPGIIGYSNDMFYGGMMGSRLEVRTDTARLAGTPQGIVLVDVKGRQAGANVNMNEEEAKKSVELAVREANADPIVSIGIITPFRHQAERINRLIPEAYADRIEADTVHRFQGDQKDIIIYSLVVTSNSPEGKIYWIDNRVPNLVNVAVTRARSTLYVVGNMDYIRAHSSSGKPLGNLVRYNNNSR